MGDRTCVVDGCNRKIVARGWCNAHYKRFRQTGDVGSAEIQVQRQGLTDYERFMSRVDTSGGPDACHPWIGSRADHGYGWFATGGRTVRAHRWLLGYLRGNPLCPDEAACHRCDNPPCCNERHLYVGTRSANMRDRDDRGRNKNANGRKAHCRQGHAYDEENTAYQADGSRKCRACNRVWSRNYETRGGRSGRR